MATFIPSMGTPVSRVMNGERHLAELLEQKLDDDYSPSANALEIMTMKVNKGLEFPVVALPGVGYMPAKGKDGVEAARMFYVATKRATQRLVIGAGGDARFGGKL